MIIGAKQGASGARFLYLRDDLAGYSVSYALNAIEWARLRELVNAEELPAQGKDGAKMDQSAEDRGRWEGAFAELVEVCLDCGVVQRAANMDATRKAVGAYAKRLMDWPEGHRPTAQDLNFTADAIARAREERIREAQGKQEQEAQAKLARAAQYRFDAPLDMDVPEPVAAHDPRGKI